MIPEKDLNAIARESLNEIARLFKMTEMILTIWDEDTKRFRILGSYGFPPDSEKTILNLEYDVNWISLDIPKKMMVLEDVIYLSAEDVLDFQKSGKKDPLMVEILDGMDQDFYWDRPGDIEKPRESEDHWHELDFFEFLIRDYNGKPIGYLEINDIEEEQLPTRLPTKQTLLSISVFVKIAGIALESARIRAKQKEASGRIEGLSSLMTHDIDRFLRDSDRTIDMIQRPGIDDEAFILKNIEEMIESTEKSLEIIEKVDRLREIESRPYSLFVRADVIIYIKRSSEKIKKRFQNLRIKISSEKKFIPLRCDPSIEDLFLSCFETIASMKLRTEEDLLVEISEKAILGGFKELDIAFSSGDINRQAWRQLQLDFSSVDLGLKRITASSDIFTKYLIVLISRKYGGKVWVEETPTTETGLSGFLHIMLPIHT